jgi:hypothetical protein
MSYDDILTTNVLMSLWVCCVLAFLINHYSRGDGDDS